MGKKVLQEKLKKWHVKLKYKMFRFERFLMTHPKIGRFVPKKAFARRALALALCLVILLPGFLYFFPQKQAEAAWLDDNFAYRQLITFTHNVAISTPRRVTITINTAALISAGKMTSNCYDSRFTDLSGDLLQFQITGPCNNASTTYDVVFPTINNGTNSAYFYYGNPSAKNMSVDVSGVTSLGTPSGGAPAINTEEKGPTPVLSWRLDEGSGTTADDASQFMNHGTLTNGPAWQTPDNCLFGQPCLKFDGVNDYIKRPYSSAVTVDTSKSGTTAPGGADFLSFSLTIGNNPNRLLLVQVTNDPTQGGVAWVTFGGKPMTLMKYYRYKAYNVDSYVYYMVNPPVGTATVYVRGNSPIASNNQLIVGAISYYNVNTVNPFGQYIITGFDLGVNQSPLQRMSLPVASASGEQVFDTLSEDLQTNGTLTVGSNQTKMWDISDITTGFSGSGSTATGGPTLNPLGWSSQISSSADTIEFAVPIHQNVDTELDVGTASMSASLWYKHPSSISSQQTLMSRYNNGGYKVYMKSTGQVCFGLDDSGTFTPKDEVCDTASTADSKWHHVEVVKSEGTQYIQIYVDGKLKTQKNNISSSGSLSGSSPTFYVGIDSNGTSNPWNGFIQDVKTYNFSKTTSQVKTDFANRGSINQVSTGVGYTAPDHSLNQGLAGYWNMDDSITVPCSSGVNHSCDLSGNGNDGAWIGAAASSSGKFGNAINLNGTSDYVDVPNSASLQITNAMTISSWVYITQYNTGGNYDTIFFKGGSNDGSYGIQLVPSTHVLEYDFWDNASSGFLHYQGNTSIGLNTWYHLSATYDYPNKVVKIYVNGVLDAVSPITTLFGTNTADVQIGAVSGSENWHGKLDDVRLYNRVLSDSEVRSLADWAPGPVGWWKLDDKYASVSAAFDSSGYGNTGTITNANAPDYVTGKIGGALNFDSGRHTKVQVGNVPLYNNMYNVTTSAWVYPRTKGGSSEARFVDKSASTGPNSGWYFKYDTGTNALVMSAAFNGGANPLKVISNENVPLNQWSYVTMTWDGTATATHVHMYINGKECTYATQTNGTGARDDDTTGFFKIGDQQGGNYRTFDGYIDDVRLYNYQQNQKQIYAAMGGDHSAVGSRTNVVGEWNFDEGSGTTAHDRSPNQSDLTLSTAVGTWLADGKFGRAWHGFSNAVMTRADDSDGRFDFAGTDDFTISTWVRSSSSTNPANAQYVLAKGTITNAGTVGYAMYFDSSGRLNFGIRSTSGVWGGSSPNTPVPEDVVTSQDIYDQQWHHVVVTKSNTYALKMYVDGKMVSQDTSLTATATLTNNIGIFLGAEKSSSSNGFNGDIDDTRIYRYVLNADEVKTDMNQAKATVVGALSTNADGVTASNSADRSFCPPGDSSTNCAAGLNAGPVGYWPLDENTGTTARDLGTGKNNGTINGLGTISRWAPGKLGSGLQFRGVSGTQAVNVGDPANGSLDFGTNSFTYEAWVKDDGPFGANDMPIYKGGASSSDPGYDMELGTGPWTAHVADGTTSVSVVLASDESVFTRKWTHLVVVVDRSTNFMYGYANGVQVAKSNIATVNSVSNPKSFTIGSDDGGSFDMRGTVDDVRVYNYARTPAQVAWDYNRGRPVGWWKFDECSGTTLYDSALNGNNGTWAGLTSAGTCKTASTAWGNGAIGKINSSLSFDGTDDYVNAGSGTSLDNLNNSGMTVMAWIKPSTISGNQWYQIVDKATNAVPSGNGWIFEIAGSGTNGPSSLGFTWVSSGTNISLNSEYNVIQSGVWQHVALTLKANPTLASDVKMYINGRETTNYHNGNNLSGTLTNDSAENLTIGCSSVVTECYNGQIDDVRVYNYQMTPAQIRTAMNNDAALRLAPLVGQP